MKVLAKIEEVLPITRGTSKAGKPYAFQSVWFSSRMGTAYVHNAYGAVFGEERARALNLIVGRWYALEVIFDSKKYGDTGKVYTNVSIENAEPSEFSKFKAGTQEAADTVYDVNERSIAPQGLAPEYAEYTPQQIPQINNPNQAATGNDYAVPF
jgi:hypothetical protein